MKRKDVHHRQPLLGLIIITSFINPFLGAAINIALPAIGEEFMLSAIGLSWVTMSFILSSAVFLLPFGKLADIAGRKRVFFIGNILIAITSLLCALSSSGGMLILMRIFQGIGSSMVFGTGVAIITSAYPPDQRGKAIGWSVTSVYIGLSLAPFLGGILTEYLSWRSIFYFTIPFQILVILGVRIFIRDEWADASGEPFDYTGSLIYILSMSALMFGFSRVPETYAIILSVLGFLGLVAFALFELKISSPVFNIRLFKSNRLFAFSNLSALINYATTFAISFLLSLFLQSSLGLSPRDAGIILVTQPVVMAVVASISGRLSDKYDPRYLASAGMAVTVAGLSLMAFLNGETSIRYLITALIIVGIGFGLFSSPNTNAIMGSVEKKFLGVASATVGTMRLTGQMFSMGIATLILQIFMGEITLNRESVPLFTASMRTTFIIFAVLCLLGVFASLARGKTPGR
ncbi:MAG: MFS transporter [Bacteroidales bacterium]|nr:MFS transporter [Bacteroidales bacterium]MBN2699000.1 MFS transporter [Bacteroidales bacterium]